MGTICAPSYRNIFMAYFEQKINLLNTSKQNIILPLIRRLYFNMDKNGTRASRFS